MNNFDNQPFSMGNAFRGVQERGKGATCRREVTEGPGKAAPLRAERRTGVMTWSVFSSVPYKYQFYVTRKKGLV